VSSLKTCLGVIVRAIEGRASHAVQRYADQRLIRQRFIPILVRPALKFIS